MSKVLVAIENLMLDDYHVDSTAVYAVTVYAYIKSASEFFGGYLNGTVKSITQAIFNNTEKWQCDCIQDTLNWLLKYDYIKINCLNESKYFYAFSIGSNTDSLWYTWSYCHLDNDYEDEVKEL